MRFSLTRRALPAALAGAAVLLARASKAATGETFRAIEVDVAPLRASGDTITARWLSEDLPDLLRRAFADHLAPSDRNAPVLVARIDSVSYGTAGSAMEMMTSTNDFIEGAAVVRSGGRTQATYPLTTSVGVGAALIDAENGGELRALALAGVFARWLPSQMGL